MGVCLALILTSQQSPVAIYTENRARMLRVNAINRQELLKQLTFHPKSLIFKTVSVPDESLRLHLLTEVVALYSKI